MEPLVVPLLVGGRILFQSVLHGAAQGDVRVDDTVRFGNNLAVDAARFVVCGGGVVVLVRSSL